MNSQGSVWWQYLLPQQMLSYFFGLLAKTKRCAWLRLKVLKKYVKHYQVDMSLAVRESLEEYESFNDFFTRQLKPGVRVFSDKAAVVLMPAEGVISELGLIEKQGLLQAKNHFYSLASLLANEESLVQSLEGGRFITIYLSPKDYHRVHMPMKGKLKQMIYVPGNLFSVNAKTAQAVPQLFARNERLICEFETAVGVMVLVLVGALIVGSMGTVWASQVNPPRSKQIRQWTYAQDNIILERGEEMGYFQLGSTVIALFPKDTVDFNANWIAGAPVLVGEVLGDTIS
jgi:phosphatidylserine decarboxylase